MPNLGPSAALAAWARSQASRSAAAQPHARASMPQPGDSWSGRSDFLRPGKSNLARAGQDARPVCDPGRPRAGPVIAPQTQLMGMALQSAGRPSVAQRRRARRAVRGNRKRKNVAPSAALPVPFAGQSRLCWGVGHTPQALP